MLCGQWQSTEQTFHVPPTLVNYLLHHICDQSLAPQTYLSGAFPNPEVGVKSSCSPLSMTSSIIACPSVTKPNSNQQEVLRDSRLPATLVAHLVSRTFHLPELLNPKVVLPPLWKTTKAGHIHIVGPTIPLKKQECSQTGPPQMTIHHRGDYGIDPKWELTQR